jgi:hypothetical protein
MRRVAGQRHSKDETRRQAFSPLGNAKWQLVHEAGDPVSLAPCAWNAALRGLGEVTESLNGAILNCLQLTSISPRKYHLSTRSPLNRSLSGPIASYPVRKSVRRIFFLTGAFVTRPPVFSDQHLLQQSVPRSFSFPELVISTAVKSDLRCGDRRTGRRKAADKTRRAEFAS